MPAGLLLLPIILGIILVTFIICEFEEPRLGIFYLIPAGCIFWGLNALFALHDTTYNPMVINYYHAQTVNDVDLIADEDGDIINLNRKLSRDIPDNATIRRVKFTNNVIGLNFGASYEYFIESQRQTETVQ